MKSKILVLLIFSATFVSCKKEEKKLISLIDDVQKARVEVVSVDQYPLLTTGLLVNLKGYSDLVSEGTELFEQLLSNEKTRKRIKNYLSQNQDIASFCSTLFLEQERYRNINEQCNEGYFDICPTSFSKYKNNSHKIIENLKVLLGDTDFLKSDCAEYAKEEVKNEY